MSTAQPQAPAIPGATPKGFLGAGGFADVFLYEQAVPRRDVAVKVIRQGTTPAQRAHFEAEANLMARMSSHPSILSVYGAGTVEGGRNYLMMEYCPPPHLGRRAAAHPLSVAQALEVGIQVAGAVETIHRAGYLHRDIKPANILLTSFKHPVLTDFGIATPIKDQVVGDEFGGASPPWASPEQQTDKEALTPAADVYSLAATVYTLLSGRSPHADATGRDDSRMALYRRALALYGALANTHTDQAACLTDLARTTADLEHLPQAETLYHQALALYDTLDEAHEDHARCLQGLATCLTQMGNRTKDAQRALEKALDILDQDNKDETLTQRLDILCDLARADLFTNDHVLARIHARHALILTRNPTISEADTHRANTTYAAVLRAQAHATTNPARRRDTLARALDHALPAALYDDERRYQLTSPAKRRAWTHNRAQHSMNQALTLAAELDNAPLLAELVAKWRTTGTLTTTPTTADPDTLTRAPGPALIMPHPRTTPLHTHPLLPNRPHTHYK